jgi:hypothetical protein
LPAAVAHAQITGGLIYVEKGRRHPWGLASLTSLSSQGPTFATYSAANALG